MAEYGDRHGIEVFAWFHPGAGRWEVDFERVRGGPRVKDVRAAIAAHRYLREYPIAVATAAGAAIRWARAMREPGRAVILDTEATDLDGYVVEIAVVDAATGATLLDTLVNPGSPISAGAQAVHGLSDADVAGASRWERVLPPLLAVTRNRTVLAYNEFTRQVDCREWSRRERGGVSHARETSTAELAAPLEPMTIGRGRQTKPSLAQLGICYEG